MLAAYRHLRQGTIAADPFRKTNGGSQVHEPGGLLSARRARLTDRLFNHRSGTRGPPARAA
jgi:hypothetical protein